MPNNNLDLEAWGVPAAPVPQPARNPWVVIDEHEQMARAAPRPWAVEWADIIDNKKKKAPQKSFEIEDTEEYFRKALRDVEEIYEVKGYIGGMTLYQYKIDAVIEETVINLPGVPYETICERADELGWGDVERTKNSVKIYHRHTGAVFTLYSPKTDWTKYFAFATRMSFTLDKGFETTEEAALDIANKTFTIDSEDAKQVANMQKQFVAWQQRSGRDDIKFVNKKGEWWNA